MLKMGYELGQGSREHRVSALTKKCIHVVLLLGPWIKERLSPISLFTKEEDPQEERNTQKKKSIGF
jgi:hypothetical protein